jgi:hypothetical protein
VLHVWPRRPPTSDPVRVAWWLAFFVAGAALLIAPSVPARGTAALLLLCAGTGWSIAAALVALDLAWLWHLRSGRPDERDVSGGSGGG